MRLLLALFCVLFCSCNNSESNRINKLETENAKLKHILQEYAKANLDKGCNFPRKQAFLMRENASVNLGDSIRCDLMLAVIELAKDSLEYFIYVDSLEKKAIKIKNGLFAALPKTTGTKRIEGIIRETKGGIQKDYPFATDYEVIEPCGK